MNLLLVEGNAAQAERIVNTLERGGAGVVRMAETPMATGAFLPRHDLTSAILLGFDTPSIDKLRVLKRVWASDCAPACFLATLPGSAGEALLAALMIGAAVHDDSGLRGIRPAKSRRLNLRCARSLSLERMMALERIVARNAQARRNAFSAPWAKPTPR